MKRLIIAIALATILWPTLTLSAATAAKPSKDSIVKGIGAEHFIFSSSITTWAVFFSQKEIREEYEKRAIESASGLKLKLDPDPSTVRSDLGARNALASYLEKQIALVFGKHMSEYTVACCTAGATCGNLNAIFFNLSLDPEDDLVPQSKRDDALTCIDTIKKYSKMLKAPKHLTDDLDKMRQKVVGAKTASEASMQGAEVIKWMDKMAKFLVDASGIVKPPAKK
jgi:hypothetical protein